MTETRAVIAFDVHDAPRDDACLGDDELAPLANDVDQRDPRAIDHGHGEALEWLADALAGDDDVRHLARDGRRHGRCDHTKAPLVPEDLSYPVLGRHAATTVPQKYPLCTRVVSGVIRLPLEPATESMQIPHR